MSLSVTLEFKIDTGNKPVVKEVFSSNITHNLTRMAKASGLYKVCWTPDMIGASQAKHLINDLENGLSVLRTRKKKLKEDYEPENGWGTHELFVEWVTEYLRACKNFPNASLHIWR